jgi:type II secretory pathway pseudopilin PulG
MTLETGLLVVALIIVAVLATIAGVLLYKVHQKNKAQQVLLEEKEAEIQAQRQRINRSIQILAQASQSDELTLTEASIRISFLLDSLGVGDEVREEFSAFYQLRRLTAHIPILEEWKKLSRQEQNDFDIQRSKHEASYRDFVLDAAVRIKGREF